MSEKEGVRTRDFILTGRMSEREGARERERERESATHETYCKQGERIKERAPAQETCC